MPSGITRAVYTNGMVYEGTMSKSGLRNGFGILYNGEMALVGWFVDDANHGNGYMVQDKEWKIIAKGWFDMGDYEGDF